MGFRVVIVLAGMSVAGFAQRSGTIQPGHFPMSTSSTPRSGSGWNSSVGWRGQPSCACRIASRPVIPFFLAPPIFPFGPYPLGPYPPVDNGFYNAWSDTPRPAGPIMNPAMGNQPPQLWNTPQPGSITYNQNTPFHLQQTPIPTPVLRDEYPPVILLKTGGAYSVTKYWIEKENLYVVTTQGDSWYVRSLSSITSIRGRSRAIFHRNSRRRGVTLNPIH